MESIIIIIVLISLFIGICWFIEKIREIHEKVSNIETLLKNKDIK